MMKIAVLSRTDASLGSAIDFVESGPSSVFANCKDEDDGEPDDAGYEVRPEAQKQHDCPVGHINLRLSRNRNCVSRWVGRKRLPELQTISLLYHKHYKIARPSGVISWALSSLRLVSLRQAS